MINSLNSKSFSKFWIFFNQHFNKSGGVSRVVDSVSEPQLITDLLLINSVKFTKEAMKLLILNVMKNLKRLMQNYCLRITT